MYKEKKTHLILQEKERKKELTTKLEMVLKVIEREFEKIKKKNKDSQIKEIKEIKEAQNK